jgi:Ca2+/H+ antiporter, TMEM165/GDT1 family
MWNLVGAVASAFGVVFVSELGDKTQLLALGYGARHGLRTVVIGLTLGFATSGAIAALVGGIVGANLPERPIGLAAGALFLIFAILTWRSIDDGDDTGHDDAREAHARARSVVASIALTIAIAEFGDKTQLATAALATQANPFATWIGATAGVVSAGTLGAVAGSRIGRRVEPRKIRIASAVLFAGFGAALIVTAW